MWRTGAWRPIANHLPTTTWSWRSAPNWRRIPYRAWLPRRTRSTPSTGRPAAGPAPGGAVQQMLAQRHMAFPPSHRRTAVTPDPRELVFDGKPPVKYDLLVAIPP